MSGICVRAEPVSDAGIGEDEPRSAWMFFDLFPELANEDTQVLSLIHVRLSPDFLKQHAMGKHFPGMFNHVFQEIIFGGSQSDRLTLETHLPSVEVHRETPCDKDRSRACSTGGPPQQGSYPSEELFHPEWLRHIVVSAALECMNLLCFFSDG